jgi:hypothetical protein
MRKGFSPNHGHEKFCTSECREVASSRYANRKVARRLIVCKICGNEFMGHGRNKMCSNECRRISHNQDDRKYYRLGGGMEKEKEYKKSEKGKIAIKKYYNKKNNSPERKDYMRKYRGRVEYKEKFNSMQRERRKREDVKLKDKAD